MLKNHIRSVELYKVTDKNTSIYEKNICGIMVQDIKYIIIKAESSIG